jgi:two-component system chemotaxis sensor kinase CheA
MDFDRAALLESFFAESTEGVASMEAALLRLEQEPDDGAQLEQLFRDAHTLKGNALSLGFSAIATRAHDLEDSLEPVRSGRARMNPALATALLAAVDELRELLLKAAVAEQQQPAREGAAAPSLAPAAEAHRTLRVDVRKLDRMLALGGEAAVARARLRKLLRDHGEEEAAEDLERISRELQEEILRARAVAVGAILSSHARTARDAAAAAGKEAALFVEGGAVEVDTSVVELLRDPLTHLVRNAVAHGIESPERRRALGKTACGTVRLRARTEAGCFVLDVEDDGRGFDREAIARTARERGREVEGLSDEQLFALAFEPGFSTAAEVSDLSGRGVGLDVVQHNLKRLRGSISVSSKAGLGSTLTLRVPLSLAIVDSLLVQSGDSTYALPLDSVRECVELPEVGTATAGVLQHRGAALPWLVLPASGAPVTGKRRTLVIVENGRGQAGIAVDRLEGQEQTVFRPLTGVVAGARGLAGSTLLGDGRIALVVDVTSLFTAAAGAARTSSYAGKES